MEVTNRLKGLDLIRVPEELWMEVCNIVQDAVIKTPRKRNAKRQNGGLRRPLKIAEKRCERQRSKGKIYPSEFRIPKNSRRKGNLSE